MSRRAWAGFGAGAAGGLVDVAVFQALGFDFHLAGLDLTWAVGVYLASSFAALGYGIGILLDAREKARADAEVIERQLRALEESQRAAAENEKLAALGRLCAGVAHEVRNPLGVIRASASMVQEEFQASDEPHRACAFICEEIDRLNGLITSLLAFSRPAEPRLADVPVADLVDQALRVAGHGLEERGISLEAEVGPEAGRLRADPDLVSQLVVDLLTNSAEAVAGGGRVTLRVSGDDDHAVLEVADSGPGIPSDAANRIFEPFYTTKASGTGLGLAMASSIARSHGGTIGVVHGRGAGHSGAGACLRVSLPREPGALHPLAEEHAIA